MFSTVLTPEPPQPRATRGDTGFRLQANTRRGTGSNLSGTWPRYATIDDARVAARDMFHDDRVVRVTIVTDTVPPRFLEWVNR